MMEFQCFIELYNVSLYFAVETNRYFYYIILYNIDTVLSLSGLFEDINVREPHTNKIIICRHGKTWRHRMHASRTIRTIVRNHQDYSEEPSGL